MFSTLRYYNKTFGDILFQRITVDTFIKLDIKPVQVLKTLEKWITNGLLSECPVSADRNHHDTRDILCKMATVVHKYIPFNIKT